MDDDDAALQRLRHAAFSRDATDDDLRSLADFEARRPVADRAAPAQPEEAQDVDVPPTPEEAEVDPAEEPRRPLSRRQFGLTIAAAVVGGALLGAVIGILATAPAPVAADVPGNWSGTSSLSVFDRDPTPLDDPGERFIVIAQLLTEAAEDTTPIAQEVEVRWIGAPGGFTTYAARMSGGGSSTICVVVTSALEEASSCVPEGDFAAEGIRIIDFGLDLRWGPTGAELWANSSG